MEKIGINEVFDFGIKKQNRDFTIKDEAFYFSGYFSGKHVTNAVFPKETGDMSGHYAIQSLFENVIFSETYFYAANLCESSFENCIFDKVDFQKCELQSIKVNNCVFNNCSFFRTLMVDSNIEHTLFTNCDFSMLLLGRSQLRNVTFLGNKVVEHFIDISKDILKFLNYTVGDSPEIVPD